MEAQNAAKELSDDELGVEAVAVVDFRILSESRLQAVFRCFSIFRPNTHDHWTADAFFGDSSSDSDSESDGGDTGVLAAIRWCFKH